MASLFIRACGRIPCRCRIPPPRAVAQPMEAHCGRHDPAATIRTTLERWRMIPPFRPRLRSIAGGRFIRYHNRLNRFFHNRLREEDSKCYWDVLELWAESGIEPFTGSNLFKRKPLERRRKLLPESGTMLEYIFPTKSKISSSNSVQSTANKRLIGVLINQKALASVLLLWHCDSCTEGPNVTLMAVAYPGDPK